MANFLFWGDLHDEFWERLPSPEIEAPIDAVLLAGDISTRGRHVGKMAEIFHAIKAPVRMVRGNHEYYDFAIEDLIEIETQEIADYRAAGVDIGVMDRAVEIIAGTRVIGATLWTDLELYPDHKEKIQHYVPRMVNDFRNIYCRRGDVAQTSGLIKIRDWLDMHWRDREFILGALKHPFEGPTIVMTHHMPLLQLVCPLRRVGREEMVMSNAAFASDMGHLIAPHDVQYWLSGHSHDNRNFTLAGEFGDIAFLSNSRGYLNEGARFDPDFVIQTKSMQPACMLTSG